MNLPEFKLTEYIGADTETDGLDTEKCKAFCIAFVNTEGQKIFLDFRITNEKYPENRDLASYILNNTKVIFHNAKFDMKMLKNINTFAIEKKCCEKFEDTMIMAYLVNEYHGSFKLDYLAEKYLGEHKLVDEKFTTWLHINKETVKKRGFLDVPKEIIEPYTIKDAELALKLFYVFKGALEKLDLWKQYEFEKSILPTIIKMERNGMKINVPFGIQKGDELEKEIEKRKLDLYTNYQIENPNSYIEIKEAFKRTGLFLVSTKKEVLTDLVFNDNKLAKEVITYRQLSKLLSGFLVPILSNTSPQTRRLHTNFNTVFTKTGRLSSSDPLNFQNLPRPVEDQSDSRNIIRALIIPEDNYYLIGADYVQEEMRIIADECNVLTLLELFKSNTKDIYIEIAKLIWHTEDIDKQERYVAKQSTLGMSYGMGPAKFVLQAKKFGFNLDFSEAYDIIQLMKDRFPEISDTLKHYSWKIRNVGFVKDRFGRRYNVPQDFSYKALNAVVQGTAAHIMKQGLIELNKMSNNKFRIINSVHDEILCEVHNDIPKDSVWNTIKTCMEDVSINFKIPMIVSRKDYNGNWNKTI